MAKAQPPSSTPTPENMLEQVKQMMQKIKDLELQKAAETKPPATEAEEPAQEVTKDGNKEGDQASRVSSGSERKAAIMTLLTEEALESVGGGDPDIKAMDEAHAEDTNGPG